MWLIVGQLIFLGVVIAVVILFALDDRKNRKEREEEDRIAREKNRLEAKCKDKDDN